jgi:16S rRNA (guanine966-N2)-methyltransferase
LRIISGTLKGRQINPPKAIKARATTDVAKESIFNIIHNMYDIENFSVLDLFAGTGNISIEFISNGVKQVTSVDISSDSKTFIELKAREFNITNLFCVKANVFNYINACKKQFDIIFADPPYELKNTSELPDLIFKNQLLQADGLLIVEHSGETKFNDHPYFDKLRKYGSVHFSFFTMK